MSESDKLLSKADALLARWRSGSAAPRPPEDYPVLTEIVGTPVTGLDAPLPEFPVLTEVAAKYEADSAEVAATVAKIVEQFAATPKALESPAVEALTAEARTAAGEHALPPLMDLPPLSADAGAQTLDERVQRRVLDAIEPFVATFIEEQLRGRIDELAMRLAASIAEEVRGDILTLVREAVRRAVEHELESRQNERSGGS